MMDEAKNTFDSAHTADPADAAPEIDQPPYVSQQEVDALSFPESDSTPLQNDVEVLQRDLGVLKEKYMRLQADFDNFKKRNAKERLDLVHTASKGVLSKLLPIMDDFERAFRIQPTRGDAAAALEEGVRLIRDKLDHVLRQEGVADMPVQPGDPFDPELHEAISQLPAVDPSQQGKVVAVAEKGYLLRDRVIRFAKVITGV